MRRFSENIINELTSTYKFRYVIINFVSTSLKQRYKKSVIGFAWVIITPMLQYLVLAFIFSYTFRIKIPNYFVYFFSGSVVFNIISGVINVSPLIMLDNEHFIKKVYIPKLVYTLNIVFREIINFVLSLIGLLILGLVFQKFSFSVHYLFLFIAIILNILFLIGVSLIISIISVYLRDLKEIVPIIMNAAFFMTPIIYPMKMLPEFARKLMLFNPFYYYIEIFRTPILHNKLPNLKFIGISFIISFVSLFIGLLMLKKFDNKIVFKL